MPVDQWIARRGQSRSSLATPYNAPFPGGEATSLLSRDRLPEGARWEVRGNRLFLILPPGLLRDTRSLRIAVCDVRGTVLKSWSGEECRSGPVSWSPSESGRASGLYLLRIWTAGGAYAVRFAVP